LITVLPTPGGTAGQKTVVFSGLTSVGSQGAAEFFANPTAMKGLLERFRRDGLTTFPPAYQVVVHCNGRDTLLLSTEYQSHTVFKP